MFGKVQVDGWTFDASLISYDDLVKRGFTPGQLIGGKHHALIELLPKKREHIFAYPVFQFDQTHRKGWRLYDVVARVNPILAGEDWWIDRARLAACHWWLTPHVELDNKTPASVIGTPRESDLAQLAEKSMG